LSKINNDFPFGFHLILETLNSFPPSIGMSQTEAPPYDQIKILGEFVEIAR